MKYRTILVLLISSILILFGVIISVVNNSITKPDLVELNRIKVNVDNTEDFTNFTFSSKYDFTIVALPDGEVLYTSKSTEEMALTERINHAITNYDSVLDYEPDGIKGKIIIYTSVLLYKGRNSSLTIATMMIISITLLISAYYYFMRIHLYRPFKRLKGFAMNIALGNLDTALPMDKDNLFGEFTESFDIMREELKTAKQRALDEERSKKELVASLSHDIKTPISIVRAASELLEINEKNESKIINIKTIQAKTLEIDTLITDLFSSALEDLSELKVAVNDIDSTRIERILIDSDPLKKISIIKKIPTCLVKADALRLGQVFGNIIANSYKYANTQIVVSYVLIGQYLRISFKDFGMTLNQEELPLLTNKFFRGKNSKDKHGAGLGLYICAQLLNRMNGSLDSDLENDGFRVDVTLQLS